MDTALRALLNSTVTVKRVTSFSPAGSEVLGSAVTLPAYVEVRRDNAGAPAGTERRTRHLVVLDVRDVAPSALGTISPDDRFWLEDEPDTDETFSRRPENVTSYKDPLTNALSHYEVTL
jgi:hypothetical protein